MVAASAYPLIEVVALLIAFAAGFVFPLGAILIEWLEC